MRAAAATLLLLCAGYCRAGRARQARIVLQRSDCGSTAYSFDPERMPEARLRSLLRLDPFLAGAYPTLAPAIDLCVEADPAYKECGARTPQAENFLHNADVNLRSAERTLAELEALDVPPELEPVRRAAKDRLESSLWLERIKYDFLRGRGAKVLRRRWRAVDPGKACAASVGKLERLKDPMLRFRIAQSEYHNCVNRRIGALLPGGAASDQSSWTRFLAAYGISAEPAKDGTDCE